MLIWGAICIPIFVAIVLLLYFKHKMVWWEFFLPFVASIVLIVICREISIQSQTTDVEWLSYYATEAIYTEDWDELVHYTEEESYTDSAGKTHTKTVHKTRVDYHAPYWELTLSGSGGTVDTNENNYSRLKNKWNATPDFVNMHRDYHSKNGNRYIVRWAGQIDKIDPYVMSNLYENRVKASNSVFKFEDVDPKKYGLYEYPNIDDDNHMTAILGGMPGRQSVDLYLQTQNSILGEKKQVRIVILLFSNKLQEIALKQEQYWKGGKKNEIVICLGLDIFNKVNWAYVFSWCENETLKTHLKQDALDMQGNYQFDLMKYCKIVVSAVNKEFNRKQFSDFDYLSVEPGMTAIFITYILTLIINIGVSIWAIKNEITD